MSESYSLRPSHTILLSMLVLLTPVSLLATVSLEDAFRAALKKSEVLQQSEEAVVQADEKVSQARGGIFPTLRFNLDHTITDLPPPAFLAFSPRNQTVAAFNVTQPIFKGFREFAGLSGAQSLRSEAQYRRDQTRNQLFRDLASNYLNVLSLEQNKKNIEELSSIYEQRVEELEARVKRGESRDSELLSAQASHMSLLAELRLVEGELEAAREQFVFFTGLPENSGLSDPEALKRGNGPLSIEQYLQKVEVRPDVLAAKERMEATDEGVAVAWRTHLPSVDLVGNYYLARPGFLSEITWDVSAKLVVPIFEGGVTQSSVREAVSKRKDATLALEKVRREARQEIRTIHQRLSSRLDHMSRLKKAVDLNKKNVQLIQREYRRGLSKNIDVQMALTDYRTAQRGYDQARFNTQTDLYLLKAASADVPAIEKEK